MDRRKFLYATVAAASGSALAGCSNDDGDETDGGDTGGETDAEASFPSYDMPIYSDWPPAEPRTNDFVLFTHLNLRAYHEADGEESTPEEDPGDEEPLGGLPFYGFFVTALWLELGMWGYPWGEALGSETEPGGMDTSALTMTDGIFVFHGDYDPDVFEAEYAEGFERRDEGGFAVFEGLPDEGRDAEAYAVSENAVVVSLARGETPDHEETVARLDDVLGKQAEGTGRMVDEADGAWLCETTGEADMVAGFWRVDGLEEADLQTGEDNENEAGIEENPVFENVDSFASTLALPEADGGVGGDEAAVRFAALYPDGETPPEDTLREELMSTELAAEAQVATANDRAHVEVQTSAETVESDE